MLQGNQRKEEYGGRHHILSTWIPNQRTVLGWIWWNKTIEQSLKGDPGQSVIPHGSGEDPLCYVMTCFQDTPGKYLPHRHPTVWRVIELHHGPNWKKMRMETEISWLPCTSNQEYGLPGSMWYQLNTKELFYGTRTSRTARLLKASSSCCL